MNVQAIVAELSREHPGSLIKVLPPGDDATEIVCEYDPGANHPERSTAVAVIDRSAPHFHRHTEERYTILKGCLTLHAGNEVHTLREGDQFTIRTNTVHWATGDAVWVRVDCLPPYSAADHILVEELSGST